MKDELTREQALANLAEVQAWELAWKDRSRVSFDRGFALPRDTGFWDHLVRGTVAGHRFEARFENRGGDRNPTFGFVLAVDGAELAETNVASSRFCSLFAAKDSFRQDLFNLTEWTDLK